MPQLLLPILLLAVVIVAAYFYLKRAQARTQADEGNSSVSRTADLKPTSDSRDV